MKSSTKVSLISAAVATALGTSAFALPPANWTDGTINASNVYYAAGGSAEVLAVFAAAYNELQPGTIDVYTDGTGSGAHPQSNSYLVLSGTTNANSSLGAGVNVGFMYKYNGGSGPNGVTPQVSPGATLLYPTLTSLAGVTTLVGTNQLNGTAVNPTYTGTFADTEAHQPDFGIADTEEKLLNQLWNLNGTAAVNLSGANSTPGWIVSFGVAVTDAVYAQKKNWSKAELVALLSGKYTAWNQVLADPVPPATVGLPMTVAGPVSVFDRGSGSGTKATENAYFFGYPDTCSAYGGKLNPYSVTGSCTAATVTHYTSGSYAPGNPAGFYDFKEGSSNSSVEDLVTANQHSEGAVAVLGLEFPPHYYQHTAGTNDYEFVAINGAYPDSETAGDYINNPAGGKTLYTNLTNGTYDYWAQTSINALTPPSANGLSLDIYTTMINTNANVPITKIPGSATGNAFPAAAPGIFLNLKTVGGTAIAGELPNSNSQNTAAPKIWVGNVPNSLGDPL